MGEDKSAALDGGADGFVSKPFWLEELLARVRAIDRRAHRDAVMTVLEVEGLRLDLEALTLEVEGEAVQLTPTQWSLLAALTRRPGRPVRRDALMQRLPGGEGSPDALHAQVSRLRKRLGAHEWRLETVWGIGYRLILGGSGP